MRSGSVIFTTRYPRYLIVFIVLVMLAFVLLLYGCVYTASASVGVPDWTNGIDSFRLYDVVCIIYFVLVGIMLFAYAVLPGLFRLFGDSYISWYAISGCMALAAFILEILRHCNLHISVDNGIDLLYLFRSLLKIIMVLTAFVATLHQCKPQPSQRIKRMYTAIVSLLSIIAVAAIICAPKQIAVLPVIVCTGAIAGLTIGILCTGVWGSGKAALVPAVGTLAMFVGFFFEDLSIGVRTELIHQLVLPLCLMTMLVCWSLMMHGKQKIQIAALEKALTAEQTTARTQAAFLASQIQPHFLYNTLTTIQELCYTDPTQAADTVVRFSSYLRQNIDFMEYKDKIPFSVELEHIENYLDIQRARFGNAIKFVKEIEFQDFELPPLTVQPLVENAVSHGIRKHNGQGTVTLKAQKINGAVFISVNDDGSGFDVNTVHSRSLENIRCRIEGAMDGEIQIDSRPKKGTTVTIKFPWKEDTTHADHNCR